MPQPYEILSPLAAPGRRVRPVLRAAEASLSLRSRNKASPSIKIMNISRKAVFHVRAYPHPGNRQNAFDYAANALLSLVVR